MVRKRENIQWAAVVWMKMPCWCQRRMGRLVKDDRKTTVTQITTRYNQGMQNTISERTTHRTLKQMGYSSRRPHRVPLLSPKNRKRRLQYAQAQQNWTIEDWKHVAWSDESRFLLRYSDDRVRIWRKEHESMDPSFLVSTIFYYVIINLINLPCFNEVTYAHQGCIYLTKYRTIKPVILWNLRLLQFLILVFYFKMYSCKAKLNFQHHYSSLQCHMILQKSF